MGDDSDEDRERRRPEPPPVEFVRPSEPAAPLPSRESPPAAWIPRPEDYLRPAPGVPTRVLGAPGQLHVAAGLLLIISALVAIGWTVALSVRFLSASEYEDLTQNVTAEEWALVQICGLIGIWGQSVALLAGVMAFSRLHWKFAVSSALVASLAISSTAVLFLDPFFGGAAAIGIAGVALLVPARREFAS